MNRVSLAANNKAMRSASVVRTRMIQRKIMGLLSSTSAYVQTSRLHRPVGQSLRFISVPCFGVIIQWHGP